MRCRTVLEKLEAYAARELASRVHRQMEAHFRSCPACRRALARRKQLEAVVRTVPAPAVPDGFADRVMALARQGLRSPQPVPRSLWNPLCRLEPQRLRMGLAATAALAAGLLVGVYLGQHTWRLSDQRSGARTPMMRADPVAASGLGYLTDSGDPSLAETYLSLASAPDDQET